MGKVRRIEDYKNKNELNLEKIIDEYSGYIYTIIENMAQNNLTEEDVQEIISDTFFILWKNTEKLEDKKDLSSYIAGIVRNLVKEKFRGLRFDSSIADYENYVSDNTRIDMICEKREKMYFIEKSIKKLKKEDIEIFNLYYYGARKVKEIAKIMNISERNVKTRLHRMRKKLRKDLSKGGFENER